jgi:hypothetical protein
MLEPLRNCVKVLSRAAMEASMTSIESFLDDLEEQGLLQNGILAMAIHSQVRKDASLTTELEAIITNALREMNAREIGIYTAAAIIIGVINSAPK